MDNIPHIVVIDSPTGSGKTSWAIDMISKLPDDKNVLYITPYILEVDRIIASCPNKHLVQPKKWSGDGSKMNHLVELVSQKRNIVSTHALLQNISDELINLLRNNDYILVLDESFQVVQQYDLFPELKKMSKEERENITKSDVQWLFDEKYIEVTDNFAIRWIDQNKMIGSKYDKLKSLIDRDMIYLVNNSLFLWTFPYEVFGEGIFKQCYIMTYLFESQFQHYYYQYFNIKYKKYHIESKANKYKMVETINNQYDIDFRERASKLITIIDNDKINRIGSFYRDIHGKVKTTDLSMNWYKNNENLHKQLSLNVYNYFKNISKSKANKRLWTVFKDFKKLIKNPLTTSHGFLEITARATNNYNDRNVLAYLINRYPNSFYIAFFSKRGIIIDSDLYALSDLIQWVWRSAIRNDNPITLYIPSERMRNLFLNFLQNKKIINYEDFDYED